MNRSLAALFAALVVGVSAAAPAYAATPAEKREAVREKLADMTPEEKAAAKEKAKAKWDAMTPEEQAAAKKRFAEKHPKAAEKAQEKAASAAK
jgi:uncharacterized Zn finger protein (UPF0148 family)